MRKRLAKLYREYAREHAFARLASTTGLVPGTGCEYFPRVAFVGEAPGAEEERERSPFVGASGRLLDRMLRGAGIERAECWVTNVVKFRPPRNRPPTAEELDAAAPYLRREIAVVRPDVVVPLGRFALSVWISSPGIMTAQGELYYSYRTDVVSGRPNSVPTSPLLFPLLHPSAVLRGLKKASEYQQQFNTLRGLIE